MEEKQRYQDTTLSAEERADALLHLRKNSPSYSVVTCTRRRKR